MSTITDRNMATSDTIIVRKPKGKGSKGLMLGIICTLMIIHKRKNGALATRNHIEQKESVISFANLSIQLSSNSRRDLIPS